jgi:hypothetical protein
MKSIGVPVMLPAPKFLAPQDEIVTYDDMEAKIDQISNQMKSWVESIKREAVTEHPPAAAIEALLNQAYKNASAALDSLLDHAVLNSQDKADVQQDIKVLKSVYSAAPQKYKAEIFELMNPVQSRDPSIKVAIEDSQGRMEGPKR